MTRRLNKDVSILIIDDEPTICAVAKAVLESVDYQVETAKDGLQAIERYEQWMQRGQTIDIVILDLNMPGMGCKEIVARLRATNSNVICILSSGSSQHETFVNYANYGFGTNLPKPYDKDELLAAVEAAFRSREVELDI